MKVTEEQVERIEGCAAALIPMPVRRILKRAIHRWAPDLAAKMDRIADEEDARRAARHTNGASP